MNWDNYQAALFDLDGVITPTAEVHMRAWGQMFNDFLASHPGTPAPYTDDDYYRYVDGKPRYDGVRAFLASRDIVLPDGTADDAPDEQTVAGLGNRKNIVFNDVLRQDGVEAFAGSVALLDYLASTDIALAIVSSSRNAEPVLRAAGLLDRFSVICDGNVAAEKSLPGKPDPDTFLWAAQQVGADAAGCVVLEDAVSGVAAGRAGQFGLVVGVDRGAGSEALTEAGADVVVADLAELLP